MRAVRKAFTALALAVLTSISIAAAVQVVRQDIPRMLPAESGDLEHD